MIKKHHEHPNFTKEGWYIFREAMFWLFVLTIVFINGTLSLYDRDYGTEYAFRPWVCAVVAILFRVSLFWNEISEFL